MKKFLAAGALALALGFCYGGAAHAQYDVRVDCWHSRYSSGCARHVLRPGDEPTPEEISEREAEDRKWVEFCQPAKRVDGLGVTRLSYAHKGCEFGRAE